MLNSLATFSGITACGYEEVSHQPMLIENKEETEAEVANLFNYKEPFESGNSIGVVGCFP